MIPKLLSAVVAAIIAFLVCALSHQFARGFDGGVLSSGGGTAVTVVGSGWGWLVGAAIFVIAVSAAILARRVIWIPWLGFAATLLAFAVAGSVARIAVPPADATLTPLPLLWLIDGAAAPLTWALAGLAVALAVTRRPAASQAVR